MIIMNNHREQWSLLTIITNDKYQSLSIIITNWPALCAAIKAGFRCECLTPTAWCAPKSPAFGQAIHRCKHYPHSALPTAHNQDSIYGPGGFDMLQPCPKSCSHWWRMVVHHARVDQKAQTEPPSSDGNTYLADLPTCGRLDTGPCLKISCGHLGQIWCYL